MGLVLRSEAVFCISRPSTFVGFTMLDSLLGSYLARMDGRGVFALSLTSALWEFFSC